jgi:hypothetical protein
MANVGGYVQADVNAGSPVLQFYSAVGRLAGTELAQIDSETTQPGKVSAGATSSISAGPTRSSPFIMRKNSRAAFCRPARSKSAVIKKEPTSAGRGRALSTIAIKLWTLGIADR